MACRSQFLGALILSYVLLRVLVLRHESGTALTPQSELDDMVTTVSVLMNPPRKRLAKQNILRASALALLLLLGGDVEANPGPPCEACGEVIRQVSERTACGLCNKQIHLCCGFQIPGKQLVFCKSCFWVEVSARVSKDLLLKHKCHCATEILELRQKIDELARSCFAGARHSVGQASLRTAANDIQQRLPQQSNLQLSGARSATAFSAKTARSAARLTPRRLLFNDHVTARAGTPSRTPSRLLRRDAQRQRARNAGFTRRATTGTNKMTLLRTVNENDIPVRQRMKALFVSRIDLSHGEHDIQEYVTRIVGSDVGVKVTKLAGLNQTYYNSFHVQVSQENFAELLDPSVWPAGTHFRPFRGQLKPFRIFGQPLSETTRTGEKRPRRQSNSEAENFMDAQNLLAAQN